MHGHACVHGLAQIGGGVAIDSLQAMELDIILCETEISTRLRMAAGERPKHVASPDEITR